MKQNSSILFHSMGKSLKIRYLGILCSVSIAACGLVGSQPALAASPEYLQSFDQSKGFKPAQRDLTEIFLELAGSLESYGSPEPWIRHVISENTRIETLYRQKFGKQPTSYRPAYMTDAYVERLVKNWNQLSPQLGLDTYAKAVGNDLRQAIKGTRGTGTIIVDIFNRHQAKIFDSMNGKNAAGSDFESLKSELVIRLELNKTVVNEERYEVAHRDAVSFAVIIHGRTMKLFTKLDESLSPSDAERVKNVFTRMLTDVGELAQSELQAGISEWAFGKASTAAN